MSNRDLEFTESGSRDAQQGSPLYPPRKGGLGLVVA